LESASAAHPTPAVFSKSAAVTDGVEQRIPGVLSGGDRLNTDQYSKQAFA
jgi:hypothetical protein